MVKDRSDGTCDTTTRGRLAVPLAGLVRELNIRAYMALATPLAAAAG